MDAGDEADDERVIADGNQLVHDDPQPAGSSVEDRFAGVESRPERLVGEPLVGASGESLS